MILERDGDAMVLDAPRVSQDKAREVPGARWDSKAGVWRYPLSWAACVVARGVFGPALEVGPKLAEWAKDEYERRVLPAMKVREEASADGIGTV